MAHRHGDAGAAFEARPPQDQGLTANPQPAQVQVFGRRDSRDTQKALRFFRDRRVQIVFVDLGVKPIAPTELRRFAARFGAASLFDTSARAYRDAGMGYLSMSDDSALEKLLSDQRLVRLPLVRGGSLLSVGLAEDEWRAWLRAADQ